MKHAALGILVLTLRRHFRRGHAVAVAVLLAVFALILLSFLHSGNGAARYLAFNVSFYFTFLLPLLAFVGGGGAWRDEMKPEAADFFLLRGVPKPLYLALRYAAHVICAEIDFLLALALVASLGAIRHVPGLGPAVPVMLLAQCLGVAAYSAFGFLCAALTSRWVIVGLAYGALVEVGLGSLPLAINKLAMSHQVRVLLHSLLAGPGPGPATAAFSGGGRLWVSTGYLLLSAVVFTALAAARFSRQELLGDVSD